MFKRSDERKLCRLPGYDYSQNGYYFVTICVEDMEHRFGRVIDGIMFLNNRGKFAEECWYDLPNHYNNCFLDEMIIMPNHVHGIIVINNDTVGNGFKPFPSLEEPAFPSLEEPPFNKNHDHKTMWGNNDKTGNGLKPFPTFQRHGLPEMIRAFKTFSARKINKRYPNIEFKWHKSFNDRIIRNEKELYAIREYIINNPTNY